MRAPHLCPLLLVATLACGSDGNGDAVFDAPIASAVDAAPPDARPSDAGPTPSPSMSFFITSEGGSGGLGGLAGADARCQRLAATVGLGGKTWRAYLSTDGAGPGAAADARDRIGTGPWHNFRGELIAADLDALHVQDPNSPQNHLDKATALDERGNVVPGRAEGLAGGVNEHDILTGSSFEGRVVAGSTCANWTSATTGKARVGHHDRIGLSPTSRRRETRWLVAGSS